MYKPRPPTAPLKKWDRHTNIHTNKLTNMIPGRRNIRIIYKPRPPTAPLKKWDRHTNIQTNLQT